MKKPLAGVVLLLLLQLVDSFLNKDNRDSSSSLPRRKRQIVQSCLSPCYRCAPTICCCPPAPTLKGSCDGEDAVAACLNNLCGQGFSCTRRGYCCRCPMGSSIGQCVNGRCPAGYVCNTNNYCCATGMMNGASIGPCINGQCPAGYICGQNNLCYIGNSATFNGSTNSIVNAFAAFPPVSRTGDESANSKQSAGGLSSFQLAALSKDNFGSPRRNFLTTANTDSHLPYSIENHYVQPSSYSGFGYSPHINHLQQQAINHAFQSHMLNPFLFSQESNTGYGSGYGINKHKN